MQLKDELHPRDRADLVLIANAFGIERKASWVKDQGLSALSIWLNQGRLESEFLKTQMALEATRERLNHSRL